MSFALPSNVLPFVNASEKRKTVAGLIESYAAGHQAADVGLTLGTCWIPGGGIIAMAGALAIQAPLVYQPMSREIANSYLVTTLDNEIKSVVFEAFLDGAEGDLTTQLGVEFFKEILGELLVEIGFGALLGVVPFIGAGIAAIFDAKIAATLTWRVGLMTAIYYENGCQWLGSRHDTYERARLLMPGGLSVKTKNRANLESMVGAIPGLRERRAMLLARALQIGLDMSGLGQIVDVLRSDMQVDHELFEATLVEIRKRRMDESQPSAANRSQRPGQTSSSSTAGSTAAASTYMRCGLCSELYLRTERLCPHCSPASVGSAAAAPTVKQIQVSSAAPDIRKDQLLASVVEMVEMLRSAGIPISKFRDKLRERGISPELIDRALTECRSTTDPAREHKLS